MSAYRGVPPVAQVCSVTDTAHSPAGAPAQGTPCTPARTRPEYVGTYVHTTCPTPVKAKTSASVRPSAALTGSTARKRERQPLFASQKVAFPFKARHLCSVTRTVLRRLEPTQQSYLFGRGLPRLKLADVPSLMLYRLVAAHLGRLRAGGKDIYAEL